MVMSPQSSNAELNPPPAGEGEIHYHSGDWVVESGDNLYRGNQTIVLKGNLTIEDGGTLTLSNVTLIMNSTFNDEFGINVSSSGSFFLTSSNITAFDLVTPVVHFQSLPNEYTTYGLRYRFEIYGNVQIQNSNISYMGGITEVGLLKGGIEIYSDDVIIENSTVFNGEAFGIYGSASSSVIINNTIYRNSLDGISLDNSSSTISFNNISYNGQIVGPSAKGINALDSDPVNISNNTIFSNTGIGVDLTRSRNVTIIDNTISNHLIGISPGKSYNLQITDNLISNNTNSGILYLDSANLIVNNNLIHNNGQAGIDIERSSNVSISNNIISSNAVRGIYLVNSSPLIMNNRLVNNTNGIWPYWYSNATIINSTIENSTNYDFYIWNSNPISLNTTFNKTKVYFYDKESNLTIQWFMHVRVLDLIDDPIVGADVEVKDINDNIIYNGTTDMNGYAKWIVSTEYSQNDTNDDNDGEDPGEKMIFTPHNVSVSKDGYTVYADPEPFMNRSKEIILKLPVTYTTYTITKAPLQGNMTVDGFTYPAPAAFSWLNGDTHTISADSPETGGSNIRYIFDYWDDLGAQTHVVTVGTLDTAITAYYYTQYKPTVTLLGTDSIHNVTAYYTQDGTPINFPGNFGLWSNWVDEDTTLSFDIEATGSTNTERWHTYEDFGVGPWNSVSSDFSTAVMYYHQYNITLTTTGLVSSYPATILATQAGNALNSTTYTLWNDWIDADSTMSINETVSISATERYHTIDTFSWTVNFPIDATIDYYHQYKPNITLKGTDEVHIVGVLHVKDGAHHNDSGVFSTWSDWVDENTTLTFDECTSGSPTRCTIDIRTWTVASAFEATIRYTEKPDVDGTEQTNYKPLVAFIFSILLLLFGAYVSNKRPLKFKEDEAKNKLFNLFAVVFPFVIAEALTGIVSLLTGALSIPPLFGAGMVVDLGILTGGLVVFLLIYVKGRKAEE
jgi:parallel beta-helix repeat protein